MHHPHPYIRHILEGAVQVQISQCHTLVAFRKFTYEAILDPVVNAHWIDGKLVLNGITYQYGVWHSINNNTELKAYLAKVLGYVEGEQNAKV